MKRRGPLLAALLATLGLVAAVSLAVAPSLAAGSVSTGAPIMAIGGDGVVCATAPQCGDGATATRGQLGFPEGLALGPAGNVYVADWGDNEIREISPDGVIAAVAGGGAPCVQAPACGDGGPATAAELTFPAAVAVDRAGNLYIADTGDNEIRKVASGGRISRFAGTGAECSQPPACGDGGAATAAQLNAPTGVAVDRAGDVFIADSGDNEIRKVSPSGTITRIAGSGSPCGTAPSCGDSGAATSAQLSYPGAIAVDQAGALLIADSGDNEVRKVSPSGTITRVAGTGAACSQPPACGDGATATSARLNDPNGIAVDSAGAVYVADAGDNEVRRISTTGRIATIAGDGTPCAQPPACGDGDPATTAQLDYPVGLALDPAGDVYVADTYDQELRWLPSGANTSFRGSSGKVALAAFAATVTKTAVTVRYAVSPAAAVALTVASTGPGVVVARAGTHDGFGQLSWNRRLSGRAAPRGRYTLTVTASAGGHSGAVKLSVRL